MQAYIPRLQRLSRGRHDRVSKSSAPELSAWRAGRNDLPQGNIRGTYVRLDTSINEGTWDGLTRESGTVTELP